jgi:soluble lytic murein transglycosylase-like protein
MPEKAGLHPHMRHLLVLAASLCVLMLSMFSLTPLGSGQSGLPIFDSAVKWAQTQQLNWNIGLGQNDQIAQQQQAQSTPVPTAAPATTDTTANTVLPQSDYVAIAQAAAIQYGISPTLFVRQINQESGFNPYAVSPGGAVGIAQFEPATAAGMGVNPYDPQDALYGAARMMGNLAAQYGGDYAKALAGYNAGSGAVDAAIAEGGAAWLSYLPAETQNYVAIIMG